MTLLSRPNEVIGKNDLMNQVWQGITVQEGSLCFHIANLQKVLGDGQNGARYNTTASGRGYCFVAPISRGEQRSRGWTSKIACTTPSASSPLSGPEVSDNAGGRNRAPADEFLCPLTDAAKERSDDQHAQRD